MSVRPLGTVSACSYDDERDLEQGPPWSHRSSNTNAHADRTTAGENQEGPRP